MSGCRDCDKCLETGATTLLKFPVRVVLWLPRLLIRLFRRKCPECGHLIVYHARRADGSFKD